MNNPLLKPRMNVDLNNYPAQYCKNCGGEIFTPGFIVKHVPALHIGAPMDQVVRQEVPICIRCAYPLTVDKTLQVGVKKRLKKPMQKKHVNPKNDLKMT